MKLNQDLYAQVFKQLMSKTMTVNDVVKLTGIHKVTAQSLMKHLLAHKVVHVWDYAPDSLGRLNTPIYKLGDGQTTEKGKQ